jgi:hypothetical protein
MVEAQTVIGRTNRAFEYGAHHFMKFVKIVVPTRCI